MDEYILEFEKPIVELDRKITEMQKFAQTQNVDLTESIEGLRRTRTQLAEEIFARLAPWQVVELARHPSRPQAHDYIPMLTTDFIPLYGDKLFYEDQSILCGFATIEGRKMMIVAHRKGHNMDERKAFNWGMPHPEGFRKALEKMKLAEKFGLPIITLVDTPGAYPGVGAEERGQARSIAVNLYEMSRLRTPIISALIGEGGSGGALAICVADVLGIMTYAYYSVITPEGCASILWKDSSVNCTAYREEAARALKITSKDLLDLGVADEIIPDPIEGAHRNAPAATQSLKNYILKHVDRLSKIPVDQLVEQRYQRLCKFGLFAVQEDKNGTATNGETVAPKATPSKIETIANQLHREENVPAPLNKKAEPQA